ncbi:hypothetical protein FIBSPDRAFT_934352 [Athelia psychrophila]|uniref:Uncharacterized protein n=1 Tax=Athelia psychrophila TaxID=1759441 RepID=A0A166FLV2_9AGAM|nr:hypothetical protein FIBSPDRAFT_934352 [Fibularhizoctonia sp. CBS 109695]
MSSTRNSVESRNHDEPPRTAASVKLSACMGAAFAFMIAGVVLSTATHKVAGSATVHSIIPVLSSSPESYGPEVMSAVFAAITTITTEIIGSVHSNTLRSILIAERRHEFYTNSRLFAASNEGGWTNPNGRLMNALMALLLVISYASSALVVMRLEISEGPDNSIIKYETGLSAPPIIVFGLSLFLQGAISLFGIYRCGPYWLKNTGMLAMTKKQINYGIIDPRPHRCMLNVVQGQSAAPDPLTTPDPLRRKPLTCQPSAWSANPSIKKAVIAAWCLIPAYTVWGSIVYALSIYASKWVSKSGSIRAVGIGSKKLSEFSWTFLPNVDTQSFGVAFLTTITEESGSLPSAGWPSILLVFVVIQSGLTLALHYCEVIINTTQDEIVWRQAVGDGAPALEKIILGVAWRVVSSSWQSVFRLVTKPFRPTLDTMQGGYGRTQAAGWRGVVTSLRKLERVVLRVVSSNWRSVFLLVAKVFCHWLFGQSFNVFASFAGPNFIGIEVIAHCAQIWYLSAVLVVFATIVALIANYKPHGPQPAAYGHFQTLADLVDEWYHVKVYWGHKSDKDGVCHAGTSGEPLLQPVQMDSMYGGELDPEWSSTAGLSNAVPDAAVGVRRRLTHKIILLLPPDGPDGTDGYLAAALAKRWQGE